MSCIHISRGGPVYLIWYGGRLRRFEMHPYCGPSLLRGDTSDPLKNQPIRFLELATRWVQQGERVGGDGIAIIEAKP
jgi:hypothetical protein